MAIGTPTHTEPDDLRLIMIAREIAIDHFELEDILSRYEINQEEWERISSLPRFTELLRSETEAWQAARNTHERTKLKAAALIEHWLPEASARMFDPKEPLPAKNETAKLVARIAGMGLNSADIQGGGGEKFSVTINLGQDHKLQFAHQVTPQVIEHEGAE